MHTEDSLLEGLKRKELDGQKLACMVENGEISKQLRRKVSKKYAALSKKQSELSERQLLRQEVKEKKLQPKKSREEQVKAHRIDLEKSREENKSKSMICLGCRKRGHLIKNCPEAIKTVGRCFRCGATDHTLKNCPKKTDSRDVLEYAQCFICNSIGHIARDCKENANGLYPKGGCCHICLQKTHLARDCPERTEEDRERYLKARQEKEDAELGPRIGHISSHSGGGDDLGEYFEETEGDRDDDSKDSDSKPFSGKSHKKKKMTQKGDSRKRQKLRH